MVSKFLSQEDFVVEQCVRPEEGLAKATSAHYDIVLLDIMMPNLDGLSLLRSLRAKSVVHVIMLTAKGDDIDRIIGLELGADDYLPKPFHPRELIARMRAVMRRVRSAPQPDLIAVGDLELSEWTRAVFRNGQPVELTTSEFDVLKILLENSGKVVGREHCWPMSPTNSGRHSRE